MKYTKLVEQTFDIKYLEVVAHIRHPEGATVNGVKDTHSNLLPFVSDNCWCPTILIETGELVNWPKGTTADIYFKVRDEGQYTLLTEDWAEIQVREYYVPNIMCPGGKGYGDYIIMKINEQGMIENWNPDLSDWKNDDE